MLRSAEELRKAQQQALAGKSGASDLQERLAEQRRATRALARLGRDILADEGRSVSDAIVERIAKTLDAAALDEGSRFQLRAGRLTEELDPPGFEALAGMMSARRSSKRASAAKPKRNGVTAGRRRVQEAQRELRAREREAAQAERQAQRAESAAAEVRRAAKAARERSDEAERALAEAEAALRKAQRG